MVMVRNQILDSVSPALSSLGQRAKWRRFGPGLESAALAIGSGIFPWKMYPRASRRVSTSSSADFQGANCFLILDGHGRVPVPKALRHRLLETQMYRNGRELQGRHAGESPGGGGVPLWWPSPDR